MKTMETPVVDRPQRRKDRWLILLGLAILVAAIAALILAGPRETGPAPAKSSPFRTFSIPSTSMEPTLRLGERAFANMQAYEVAPPVRGDIVVLTLPRDPATFYLKRIVGLPGEKVQVKNGILQINGRAVPTEDAGEYKVPSRPDQTGRLKLETLPNGAKYTTLDLMDNGFYDNTPVYQVPSGNYLVLGDNRDNSTDSRVLNQFGYIPRANVLGRISLIYWSWELSRIGTVPK
jgi:signal peptidase I